MEEDKKKFLLHDIDFLLHSVRKDIDAIIFNRGYSNNLSDFYCICYDTVSQKVSATNWGSECPKELECVTKITGYTFHPDVLSQFIDPEEYSSYDALLSDYLQYSFFSNHIAERILKINEANIEKEEH